MAPASAAASGSRCSRADCTSLREELELLRGDLQELEGENEQLHDKVAGLQSDLAAQEASTAQQLHAKEDEVARLVEAAEQLAAQLETMRQQQQTLGKERHAIESPSEVAPSTAVDQECAALRAKNEALERELESLRVQAEHAASMGLTAQRQAAEDSQGRRTELYTALKENEELRAQTVGLQAVVEHAKQSTQEYEALMRALQDQQEAFREAVDEQTLEITQLHTKITQLEREKQALEAKLLDMDEHESDVEALLGNQKAAFDAEKAILSAEVLELRRSLQQQQLLVDQQRRQGQVEAPNAPILQHEGDSTARATMEDMERQLERLQELRVRDKSTILELNQRVLQQQSDLESLAEHLDVDAVVQSAVQTALEQQKATQTALEQEKSSLTRRVAEQRALVGDLELRQSVVEQQLAEAQEWNARYEQQAGLEDVVKHTKKLRAQLDKQQQANVALRGQLDAQVEATSKLHVAFERLKHETNKPEDFEYDDLELAEHLKGQLAVNGAVMTQMELQIHELEAERLRFLQKLRDQARLTGRKLYEQHGLTTEQWSVVEEFIDRVKHTPEVAKKLLQHESGGNAAGMDVAAKKELAASEVEISRLLQELVKVRGELEAVRAEATTPRESSEDSDGRLVLVRERDEARRKVRDQEEELQHLKAEMAFVYKEKQQLQTKLDATSLAGTMEDAQSHEQQEMSRKVDADTQTKPHSSRSAGQAKDYDSDEVESLSETDEDGADLVSGSRPVPRVKSSTGTDQAGLLNQSDHAEGRNSTQDWSSHADSIALMVAKAIEAQFAMLQAHRPSVLAPAETSGRTAVETSAEAPQTVKNSTDENPECNRTETTTASASAVPTSPSCRPSMDALAFESEEEMMQQLDCLRELNVCLDELVESEAQKEQLQQRLQEHEKVFQSLMDQHTVLYQHFFHMHAQYTDAEIHLRGELEQAKQENKDFQLKCQRYEAGLHLLGVRSCPDTGFTDDTAMVSGNEAQLRSQVIELTRKTAVLEVNEARLKRKYQQLHNDWRGSTAHNKLLENEWSEMEKTLKYRILYLESWKQGADEMMERMEKTLDRSVLRDFADKQQKTMVDIQRKYGALSEAYADIQARYLQLYDLPSQLSRARHELALLQAEKSARSGSNVDTGAAGDPKVLQTRVDQLEEELRAQSERVKELEEAQKTRLLDDELVVPSVDESTASSAAGGSHSGSGDDGALQQENSLLYERISEVEQLYESLALECSKYKEIAALAASQANTLSKRAARENGSREQQEQQLRELMAASEDHAVVGELQHQLLQIKATYQQFLAQYDLVTESQQQSLLQTQRLELELEKKAQELSAVREKSSDKLQTLETAVEQVKERDWTARTTKWEAFRKRLDALEGEMETEQQRRKQLEKELEDRQATLPSLQPNGQRVNAAELGRLQRQVDALESRERLLLGQLEDAAKASGTKENEQRLRAELQDAKTLNGDLMRQVEAVQARLTELLQLNGKLEDEKRSLRSRQEDLQLELEHVRAGLTPVNGGRGDNQRSSGDAGSPSHSPLMRQKVGMYEKDQAELQQAAQATIASLKQLVSEKNALLDEYQRKLASVRASSAQDKAQDRLETTELNRKLFEDNQRMIAQLQEATATIGQLERSGKSKQALQAAEERHDQVLQQWKQAEVALEEAKQSIRELQLEREALRSERDLAEARAGEALEELVLLKQQLSDEEQRGRQRERQVVNAQRDVAQKEQKLKLLRDAVVKLKEEFLKAEDRHAVELAKAQHTLTRDAEARKRKAAERREEEVDAWREDKTRLESQVQMLQEKLALERKRQQKLTKTVKKKPQSEEVSVAPDQALRAEVERLKRLLKDKVVSEARAVEELERKLKLLQAQNAALREASTSTSTATTATAGDAGDRATARETLASERKLQRRVDVLMLRLKEKQAEVTRKDDELAQLQTQLKTLQTKAEQQQEKLAKAVPVAAAPSEPTVTSGKRPLEELERQNAVLRETLVLKRKEWEEAFTAQMERYETQLQRVRRRLAQHGVSSADSEDDEKDDGKEEEVTEDTKLQREERRFLVGQELRDELLALGTELRDKEQQVVAKDTTLLELQLEVESLRLELQRLQRKSNSSASASEQAPTNSRRVPQQRQRGVKSGGAASWAVQERLELEEVVANMKKVIEKLRTENERLQKAVTLQAQTAASPERVATWKRKLQQQREAREHAEAQVETLRREIDTLKRDKLKLQRQLRARPERDVKALEQQLEDTRRQLQHAEQESVALRRTLEDTQQDATTEALDAERQQLEKQTRALRAQVLALEDENARLTGELAAFDEDFFEEIEDLKYKYAQAVRDKRRLESRLAGAGS